MLNEPASFDVRMLFIGNSYTSRNGLPTLVAAIAAASGEPRRIRVKSIVAGGASLRRHWNAGTAQKVLEAEPWDYVVLQEQSTLPIKNRSRYHENVRLFDAEIGSHGAKTVLYLTWPRQNAPQSQETIVNAVEAIAQEIGAAVVPVGRAWQIAMRQAPGLELYVADGSHPSVAGSYLAACVFCVRLFGDPVSGWSVSDSLNLDRKIAALLHESAWRSCVSIACA